MRTPDAPTPKWSRRQPKEPAQRSIRWRLLLVASLAFAAGFATYRLWPQQHTEQSSVQRVAVPSTAKKEVPDRLVSLFFPLGDGSGLASIIQKRPACPDEESCLRDLLSALSENPGAGLFPLLPQHSDLKSVRINGATATVNLSRETIQHLPGGVQSERLTLAALVDTLAVNFPRVQQLSVEIDGVPASTLKGHVDLTTPFMTDFSLVRRALLPAPPIESIPPSQRSQ